MRSRKPYAAGFATLLLTVVMGARDDDDGDGSGGAQPKNISWQVAGQATLGTTADFKGIVLCQTAIVLNTGAVMNGRALAQTAVTLDANAVTQP